MAKNFNQRARTFSEKLFERLLLAYPKAHRDEYGAAMLQLFRDQYRDAWAESQNWGVIKLWLRVLPDWASTSIRERLAALNERKTMNDKLTSLAHDRTTPTAVFIRVFLAVFLITIIVATAITFILPETYASTCRIMLRERSYNTNSLSDDNRYDPYFIQTQLEIMNSEAVLVPVINELNLNTNWGKKYFNHEPLKTSETLKILKERVVLAPMKNTMIIAITVFSDDKNEAAQIANAIEEQARIFQARHERIFGIIIIEKAVPGHLPVKPNKPLNIFLGAVVGGFLGLVIGAVAAFASVKFGDQNRKRVATA